MSIRHRTKGIRDRVKRKERHDERAKQEHDKLEHEFYDKIKVRHICKSPDTPQTYLIVEFNLTTPLSANQLLNIIQNQLGDIID